MLYVGIVLISNGICGLTKVDPKSTAVMNFFVGGLSIICNIVVITYSALHPTAPVEGAEDIAQVSHHLTSFYGPATGLLFGFTYLYAAINHTFGLDWRPYSWYSLFVAINTIPAAILSHYSDMLDDHKVLGITEGDWWAIIWLAWGVLWLTAFIENILKIPLGKFTPWLAIIEGILTAWIPAWLLFIQHWV
ncbi:acid-activated urea channel [Helicobacter pylori Hp H-6]|uniref:Acid-activated urea channel n=1 Tax=Helicobacter pylori Hp H-6 TaxID=992061 RepID=J0DAT0_HELPX|nr:acid-activated urea channel [Helicobacter pylori Hp H-6]